MGTFGAPRRDAVVLCPQSCLTKKVVLTVPGGRGATVSLADEPELLRLRAAGLPARGCQE